MTSGKRQASKDQADGAPVAHKDRRGRRVRVDCRLFLFGDEDFEVEAHAHDLSAGGCSAECSVPLRTGMEFRVSIFLKDHRWPIRVEGAIVRWVAGRRFGLEFFRLQPAVQDRVRQYIWDHRHDEV